MEYPGWGLGRGEIRVFGVEVFAASGILTTFAGPMAGGVFGWRCRRRARIMIDVMTPTPREMVPNGSRRSPWHDYSRHAVYLVTLIRGPQTNPFSEFVFDSESGRRTLDLNLLPEGEHVDDAIQVIEKSFEGVEILMYEILPDYAIFVVHNASRDALTLQQLIFLDQAGSQPTVYSPNH